MITQYRLNKLCRAFHNGVPTVFEHDSITRVGWSYANTGIMVWVNGKLFFYIPSDHIDSATKRVNAMLKLIDSKHKVEKAVYRNMTVVNTWRKA